MTIQSIKFNYQHGTISKDEALTELMQVNGGQWAEAGRMLRKWER